MIIKVERHESIGSLHSLSREYFFDSTQTNLIQVYLSIKIFPHRSAGTAAMVAMLKKGADGQSDEPPICFDISDDVGVRMKKFFTTSIATRSGR